MITTVKTENSTYEFDDEKLEFRRTSCSKGKPRNFDNVWTPFFSRTMYGPRLMIFLPEVDKYGAHNFILTSNVVGEEEE